MALQHPIRVPWEGRESDLPRVFGEFHAIAGRKNIVKRLAWIANQLNDPFLRGHITDKFSLELALFEVTTFFKKHGQFPPVSNPRVYQLFAFISQVTAIHKQLSSCGMRQLTGRIQDGLKSDYGLAPLDAEFSIIAHVSKRGFEIEFADFAGSGQFEYLIERDGLEIELECKTIGADIGRRIKRKPLFRLYKLLDPTIRTCLARINGGMLIRISVTNALPTHERELNGVARIIEQTLLLGQPASPSSEHCRVEVHKFEMASSPFGANSGKELSEDAIDSFVHRYTGRMNAESMHAFRPGKAALVLVVVSDAEDDGVNDWFAEPRKSVNRQFSGTRPAIMVVQMLGLSSKALLEIANDDMSGLAARNGLQVAATRILDEPSRKHLHSLIIRGHPSPEFLNQHDGGVEEKAPTYCFYNSGNAYANDPRCRIFK